MSLVDNSKLIQSPSKKISVNNFHVCGIHSFLISFVHIASDLELSTFFPYRSFSLWWRHSYEK